MVPENKVTCSHCGAVFIDGIWIHLHSGKPANNADLAARVCQQDWGNRDKCVNPNMNAEGGRGWQGEGMLEPLSISEIIDNNLFGIGDLTNE